MDATALKVQSGQISNSVSITPAPSIPAQISCTTVEPISLKVVEIIACSVSANLTQFLYSAIVTRCEKIPSRRLSARRPPNSPSGNSWRRRCFR